MDNSNKTILKGEKVTIEVLTPQVGKIYQKDSNRKLTCIYPDIIILDYGNKTKDDILDCSFKFKGDFKINGTSSSCGCTKPTYVKSKDEENTYITKVSFDPNKIGNGKVTKIFSFQTNIGNIQFKLQINH